MYVLVIVVHFNIIFYCVCKELSPRIPAKGTLHFTNQPPGDSIQANLVTIHRIFDDTVDLIDVRAKQHEQCFDNREDQDSTALERKTSQLFIFQFLKEKHFREKHKKEVTVFCVCYPLSVWGVIFIMCSLLSSIQYF